MIAKLTGTLESYGKDWVVLDVHDVGYLVHCPPQNVKELSLSSGGPISLWIETMVREERLFLYGFQSPVDRDCFRLVLTVQGVGAKVALSLISDLGSQGLLNAIARQDRDALRRVEGVGNKLAARLLLELKEKSASPAIPEPLLSDSLSDVLTALVGLGYSRSQAYEAVCRVDPDHGRDTAGLIRACLQRLDKPASL